MSADKDARIAELEHEVESLNADFIANVRTTKAKPCSDKDARIAELEARSDRLYQLNVDAAKEFRSERIELERKLAEQQALIKYWSSGHDLPNQGHEELNNLIAKAKEEEREECAMICNVADFNGKGAHYCADAIRNRSKPQGETKCR